MLAHIPPGKVSMVIDGQFGSCGKGLVASWIGINNHVDIACASLSPNAGHTGVIGGDKIVTKMLPIIGILQDRSTIYITADSVIDVDILFSEIDRFNINPDRIVIHPSAAIVDSNDYIMDKTVEKIASTMSGTGGARASKIMRQNILAWKHPKLSQFVKKLPMHELLDYGCSVFVETGQGFSLGLNHGGFYPHCTSRDVLPSCILGGLGVDTSYRGDVFLVIRTFPIRVGNIYNSDGELVGYSGDFYADSTETTWECLNVPAEYTTVTHRVRRVATFSKKQYKDALDMIRPDVVILNFINYIRECDLELFNGVIDIRCPDFVANGADVLNMSVYEDGILERVLN